MESRIDRRGFLVGILMGAGAASTASCGPESRTGAPSPAEQPIADFELDEVTVRELQTGMNWAGLPPAESPSCISSGSSPIDKDGGGRPGLHSIIEVILLSVLTGADPRDFATSASEGRGESDYTRFLDANGLSGKRVGVARQLFGFHNGVDR